jgi:hypothetical protein
LNTQLELVREWEPPAAVLDVLLGGKMRKPDHLLRAQHYLLIPDSQDEVDYDRVSLGNWGIVLENTANYQKSGGDWSWMIGSMDLSHRFRLRTSRDTAPCPGRNTEDL